MNGVSSYRQGSQAHVDAVYDTLWTALSKAKELNAALTELQVHTNNTALAASVNRLWLISDSLLERLDELDADEVETA